ncbi:CBS domain-containing protein [Tahibacter soli]|uniref:CBS domain-containing protein n=1 Tax=Tahibacter soli TaxID=2983605 RepID=A0A9X3YS33_9GAMM|nr:CBS domain-containing protein [Tahibacter soli]MDC8016098.1 CBS domain-containing protein [Tahibacter soli]
MKIRSVMSRNVHVLDANASLRAAALMMQREDIGSVPVSENDKLIGMVTDRDIVVRAVAEGWQIDTPLREVMSSGVKYCYDDDEVDDVARNMSDLGVRRLPVVDRAKNLVGFVSLANISSAGDTRATGELLQGTAQPH